MTKNLNFALLLDCYAAFLTPHQAQIMEQYYCADLSLGEIAEIAGITRQSVHDAIKRAEGILYEMEDKLHFAERLLALQEIFHTQRELLKEIDQSDNNDAIIRSDLCRSVQQLIDRGLLMIEIAE